MLQGLPKTLGRTIRSSMRGIGKFTAMFLILVVGVVVYCAYNIIPFYYYYFELVNQMEAHIRVASTYTDKEIREKMMYHIKKLQIPIEKADDLVIQRRGQTMVMHLAYNEVFYVTWQGKDYDIHVFHFVAHAEGEF
jgi:hypothetical protein